MIESSGRRMRLHLTVIVFLFAGCDSSRSLSPSPLPLPKTSETVERTIQPDSVIEEVPAMARFEIALNTVGEPRLNEPFAIKATITTRVPGDRARVTVTLPDLELAKLSKEQIRGPLEAIHISPVHERNFGAELGHEEVIDVPVTIDRPGYFRVSVAAFSEGNTRMTWNGSLVQQLSADQIWVYLDGTSARVTRDFDETVFPDSLAPVPGPLKRRRPILANPSIYRAPSRNPTFDPYQGRLVYWDNTEGGVRAVPNAQISGDYYDWYTNELVSTELSYTDGDGYFGLYYDCEMWFSGTGTTYNARIDLKDGDYYVQTSVSVSDTCPEDPGPEIHMLSNSKGGRLWRNADRASVGSYQFNRTLPPQTHIKIKESGNSVYSLSPERIDIPRNTHIEDDFGTFIIAHEMGHRFQHKTLGGLPGACSGGHVMNSAYTLLCAYTEGFGDFFGVATQGSAIPDAYNLKALVLDPPGAVHSIYGFTYGYWCNGGSDYDCPENTYTKDGALAEAAVAGFFYDLATSNGNGLGYGSPYVGDVVNDCQVYSSGWMRAQGPEHLVPCFERRLVDYHGSGYFPEATYVPSSWSSSASTPGAWDADDITAVWQYDLYPIGTP